MKHLKFCSLKGVILEKLTTKRGRLKKSALVTRFFGQLGIGLAETRLEAAEKGSVSRYPHEFRRGAIRSHL